MNIIFNKGKKQIIKTKKHENFDFYPMASLYGRISFREKSFSVSTLNKNLNVVIVEERKAIRTKNSRMKRDASFTSVAL